MSDTLDKLKALNDKLEVKLKNKNEPELKFKKKEPKRATEDSIKSKRSRPKKNKFQSGNDFSKIAKQFISTMSIDIDVESVRAQNIHKIAELYLMLNIDEKVPSFDNMFIYKAMNISGIGLKGDEFGVIREGKYCQIIAITYELDKHGKKKAKNVSLGYFGKVENLSETIKNDIMEFVFRWRYEKAFCNLRHYEDLIGKIKPKDKLF